MRTLQLLVLSILLVSFCLPAANAPAGWVIGWGYNNVGQAIGVQNGIYTNGLVTVNGEVSTNIVAISAAGEHSLALKSDGTVVAWGGNQSSEATVPAGLNTVKAISAGSALSLALKTNSTVVSWGYYGITNILTGLSNVMAISAGSGHVLALKSDGTVIQWGEGGLVIIGLTNVIAIDCAKDRYGDNLVLKSDGTIAAWGPYANSSLGLSNIIAIAAAGGHSLALRRDGIVIEWHHRSDKPQPVVGISNVVAIAAAGESSSMALNNDGSVIVWGDKRSQVPAGLSNVVAIATDGYTYLAITTNHAVAEKFRQK